MMVRVAVRSASQEARELLLKNDLRISVYSSCLRFCVLDDESSEQTMVNRYRSLGKAYKLSLAGDGANNSGAMDLLLGPGTFQFRQAAAQVSNEYQIPMLLWSLPEELSSIAGEERQPLQFFQELTNRSSSADSTGAAEQQDLARYFQDSTGYTCANNFSVPSGSYLRQGAEFLNCEGPCQPERDLDYCCKPDGGLAVSGRWTPSDALLTGDWDDACLRGESNGTVEHSLALNLSLGRSSLPVSIWLAVDDEFREPEFIVQGRSISPNSLNTDVLSDGAVVTFDLPFLAAAQWYICARQNCSAFTCPSSYSRRTGDAHCTTPSCDDSSPLDIAACCVQQATAPVGFLSRSEFIGVFDLLPPVEVWAMDLLHQLKEDEGNKLLCIAEADASRFFTDLCISYMHYAMTVLRYETTTQPVIVAETDLGMALTRLAAFGAAQSPSVVLVCSTLSFYVSSFFFMQAKQMRLRSVISWATYDSRLIEATGTGGSALKYAFLEPRPWPTTSELIKMGVPAANAFRVLASWQEDYQTLRNKELTQHGSFSPHLLFLMSAWQVLDFVGLDFVSTRLQSFDQADFGRYTKRLLLEGLQFRTFLSPVTKFDQRGERTLVQRRDLATQQFIPDPNTMTVGLSPAESWQAAMARYTFSVVRSADPSQPILPVSSEATAETQIYPCPSGCVEAGSACEPCPPGSFRARTGSSCQQCAEHKYQDRWAADRCFECPEGSTCNASLPPRANYGWFVHKVEGLDATHEVFSSQLACSIRPGGGLQIASFSDLTSWDASKSQITWTIGRCNPPEICLGDNVCLEGHEGTLCKSCKPRYSRYVHFTQICEACPNVLQQLAVCVGIATLQLFMAAWLSRSTLDSAEESSCLEAPLVLTLLQSLQIHALLSRTVIKDFNLPLTSMVPVADVLMTPFLLPITSCFIEAESVDNVQLHILSIAISALLGYFLVGLLFLVRMHKPTAVNDVLRHIVALNEVTLPYCIYWATSYTTFCSVQEVVDSGPLACFRLSMASYSLMAMACTARILEVYAVYRSRHDLNRIQVRQRLGLIFSALQPHYYLWFAMEGSALFVLAGAMATLDTTSGVILIFVFQFTLRVFIHFNTPFWTVNRQALRRVKRRISALFAFAAAACALGFIFESWVETLLQAVQLGMVVLDASYTRLALEEFHVLEVLLDVMMFVILIFVVVLCLWKIIYNKFAFTWAIMELTGSPMGAGKRKIIHMARMLFRQRSIQVSIKEESTTRRTHTEAVLRMDTKAATKTQRDDLLVSMRMALLYRLSEDAPFRFTDVRQLLMLATKGILRTHRSVWQKHFIDIEAKLLGGHSDPTKGYGAKILGDVSTGVGVGAKILGDATTGVGAKILGLADDLDKLDNRQLCNLMFRRNGEEHSEQKIFPEEINAAVQDMCVTAGRPKRQRKPLLRMPKVHLPKWPKARHEHHEEEEDEEETPTEREDHAVRRQVLRRPEKVVAPEAVKEKAVASKVEQLSLSDSFLECRHALEKAARAAELLEKDGIILEPLASTSFTGMRLDAWEEKAALATSVASKLYETFHKPNPPASALSTMEQLVPKQVKQLRLMRNGTNPEELVSPMSSKLSEVDADHHTVLLGNILTSKVPQEEEVEEAEALVTAEIMEHNNRGSQRGSRGSRGSQRSSSSGGPEGNSFEEVYSQARQTLMCRPPPKMELLRLQQQGGIGRSTAQLHRTVQQAAVASP
ncbi:SMC1 [Symbiodinium natans]|uniref:SMC1 protein n=1 Tax=Symbiodinium natans TaxID=878477 RepID=A0A812V7K0_9DINO|nr:SMC1 [Symbiodinium natans]